MIRRNHALFRFAFIGACALCAVLTAVLAASARASDTFKTGAEAEWYPAKTILMHMPDEEIFLGVMHPAAALFEKSFSLQEAQGEFMNYVKNLTEQGAEVIRVKDVLLDGTLTHQGLPQPGEKLDELRAFASEFLQIDISKLPPEMRPAQEEYKRQTLTNLSPRELVRIILLRPTVILEQTHINTELKAKYEEAPMMNLYFCRDQMITTAKGIVISKMNSTQRADETKVMKFVLKKLGVEPIYEVTGDGRLEGGDYFSAGDVALIGQGLRTNPEGVRQLLEHMVFGTPTVAVVKDSWENQEQMHLDTYFNIIGPKLAVLVDMRMNLPDKPASPDITTLVDLYELQDGKYVKTISDRNFQDWLETDLGFELIPVSRADQNRYAINFLAVRANRILAIDGASRAYKQALRERGVDATWMDFSALTSGYGAAHCMTQVIRREKPIDADMMASVDASRKTAGTVVMVSPDSFGFNEQTAESNLFQSPASATSNVHVAAMNEFNAMVKKLVSLGVDVITLASRPDKKTPDAVFPNNWFSVHTMSDGHRALVLYPMLAPDRRGERQPRLLMETLKQSGKKVQEIIDLSQFEADGLYLEGTGSMVFERKHRVVFAAVSPRTSLRVLQTLASRLGYRVVAFHSTDAHGTPIYHTNVMMGMGKDFCVICLESITDVSERRRVTDELARMGKTIIPITLDQVSAMCGNIIELRGADDARIILLSQTAYNSFTDEQKADLSSRGTLCPVEIPTLETIGGGSARCMVAEVH